MKMIANELESSNELLLNDKKNNLWHVKNDILCKKNRWYIFLDFFKTELLKRNHDDFNARHFDMFRTIKLIKWKYYWFWMTFDIKQYVDVCTHCH
jgi:hypothetical protein